MHVSKESGIGDREGEVVHRTFSVSAQLKVAAACNIFRRQITNSQFQSNPVHQSISHFDHHPSSRKIPGPIFWMCAQTVHHYRVQYAVPLLPTRLHIFYIKQKKKHMYANTHNIIKAIQPTNYTSIHSTSWATVTQQHLVPTRTRQQHPCVKWDVVSL